MSIANYNKIVSKARHRQISVASYLNRIYILASLCNLIAAILNIENYAFWLGNIACDNKIPISITQNCKMCD